MYLSIIVAYAENRVIGKENDMPWHLPDDLRFFKKHTTGKPIIMGRKTWESIGSKPLPKRLNIVISRNKNLEAKGAAAVTSLEKAIALAQQEPSEEAFIIGGGNIYAQSLPLANRLYLTEIRTKVEGDTFFPGLTEADFKEISKEHHAADEKHAFAFDWRILERKQLRN